MPPKQLVLIFCVWHNSQFPVSWILFIWFVNFCQFDSQRLKSGHGDGSVDQSDCHVNLRTWVQIPRTHGAAKSRGMCLESQNVGTHVFLITLYNSTLIYVTNSSPLIDYTCQEGRNHTCTALYWTPGLQGWHSLTTWWTMPSVFAHGFLGSLACPHYRNPQITYQTHEQPLVPIFLL